MHIKSIMTFSLLFSVISVNAMAKDKILLFTKKGKDFEEITRFFIKSDLEAKYEMQEFQITNDTPYAEFAAKVKDNKPKLIILMDNKSVSLAKEFYEKDKSDVQSIAIMGLNYKALLAKEKNICGIAYEVPSYTLVTQFKFAADGKKLVNVLTFYRGSVFSDFIKESKERLGLEKIKLEAVDVEKESGGDVEKYLNTKGKEMLLDDKKYDAVFVLLDSGLLTPSLFSNFWLKNSAESKIPFIIGAESLVSPKMNFATFGMGPNLQDLAGQTVQMAQAILEDGQKCTKIKVEDLIGVNQFWNKKKAEDIGIKRNEKAEVNILAE